MQQYREMLIADGIDPNELLNALLPLNLAPKLNVLSVRQNMLR